jgi:hypothetical protein
MDFLYSIFFGAGVAAFAYSKMGRRVGYGNAANVWLIVGVVFVIATIFFLTVLKFLLNQ